MEVSGRTVEAARILRPPSADVRSRTCATTSGRDGVGALPVVVRPDLDSAAAAFARQARPQMLEDFRQPNAHEALRPSELGLRLTRLRRLVICRRPDHSYQWRQGDQRLTRDESATQAAPARPGGQGRTAVTSISTSQSGLAKPATKNRSGRKIRLVFGAEELCITLHKPLEIHLAGLGRVADKNTCILITSFIARFRLLSVASMLSTLTVCASVSPSLIFGTAPLRLTTVTLAGISTASEIGKSGIGDLVANYAIGCLDMAHEQNGGQQRGGI